MLLLDDNTPTLMAMAAAKQPGNMPPPPSDEFGQMVHSQDSISQALSDSLKNMDITDLKAVVTGENTFIKDSLRQLSELTVGFVPKLIVAILVGRFEYKARLVAYTTKKDLSGLGGILIMALIGLIIASVINIFWGNSAMDAIITYVGVFIFVGLTAWDTQKIKQMCAESDSTMVGKVATMGALSLYLDFINLFLYLLRFFGRTR